MSNKVKKQKSLEELLVEAMVPEDEQLYKVPENWVWTKINNISNLTDYVANGSFKTLKENVTVYDYENYAYYVRLYDIKRKVGHLEQKYVDKSSYDFLAKSYLSGGEILVANIGSVGEVYIMPNLDRPATIAPNMILMRVNKKVNNKFIYYFLSSPTGQRLIEKITTGTTQAKINKTQLKTLNIPFPNIKEQYRVVNKVERLLNTIDEAKQLIDEAKQTFELRRASVLDKAFRGELTAKWRKENNVKFSIEVKKLEELIENGPQNGLYKPKSAYGEGTLIVRIDNFYSGWINEWETLKRLKLDEKEKSLYGLNNNDLLINRVNSIEYLGKSALVRNLTEPCVFESNVMRIKLNELVDPEYLILYLNSSKGLQELRKNAKHAVNQASINQQDVKNMVVPLPIMEEQKEIVRAVSSILHKEKSVINIISTQERNLSLLKDSILSKAFRGELGTNDPTEENAIELLKEVLQEQIN